jgi:hypothetical protein
MLMSWKLAFSTALVLGTTSACLAQNRVVPEIDTQNMCRENEKAVRALVDVNEAFWEKCVAAEKEAREKLVQEWPTFPALAKERCVQPDSYMPTYIGWLTCLETAREVSKLQQERSTSTPAGSDVQEKKPCPIVEFGEDGSIKSVVACDPK